MVTILSLAETIKEDTAVALGYFDGVHLGHRAVIKAARRYKSKGLKTCVFSFSTAYDNPGSGKGQENILTKTLKEKIMRRMGADYYVIPDFTEFKDYEPERFVKEVLVEKLSAKVVCCGKSFRFGKGASGDVELLGELCEKYRLKLVKVPDVLDNGEIVSSTRIRELLKDGNITEANRLLGKQFSYDYLVVHGDRFGRTIDTPTINQHFEKGMITPRMGVYASYVMLDGEIKPAVTDIGIKPTVGGALTPISETYILDYTGNLYKKRIEVCLVQYMRDEKKFESIDELKAAIQRDAKSARERITAHVSE